MKPGVSLSVEVFRLTPSDVARGAEQLTAFECSCVGGWRHASEERRQAARTVVRAALVGLLQNDAWLPGSVQLDGSRIDVHLTIEMDPDTPGSMAAMVKEQLDREKRQARDRLVALLGELEVDDGTAP